jgi:hypothetical protein
MARPSAPEYARLALPGPEVKIPVGPDVLRFKEANPPEHRWAEQEPWKEFAQHRSLLRKLIGPAVDVIRSGWTQKHGAALEKNLRGHQRVLSRVRALPPCKKPSRDWSKVLVVQPKWAFVRLLNLSRATLVRARWLQWKGRPDDAIDEVVGVLRFACRASHVPSVIIRMLAVLTESEALPILREVKKKASAAGCRRLAKGIDSHLANRGRTADLAAVVWLMGRADLHSWLASARKTPMKGVSPKRYRAIIDAIRSPTTALFGRYLAHVRQGLKTSGAKDWKALDGFVDTLRKTLAPYKLKRFDDWNAKLTKMFDKHRGKPAATLGELLAKLFMKLTAVESPMFKRCQMLDRKALTGLRKLKAETCK